MKLRVETVLGLMNSATKEFFGALASWIVMEAVGKASDKAALISIYTIGFRVPLNGSIRATK